MIVTVVLILWYHSQCFNGLRIGPSIRFACLMTELMAASFVSRALKRARGEQFLFVSRNGTNKLDANEIFVGDEMDEPLAAGIRVSYIWGVEVILGMLDLPVYTKTKKKLNDMRKTEDAWRAWNTEINRNIKEGSFLSIDNRLPDVWRSVEFHSGPIGLVQLWNKNWISSEKVLETFRWVDSGGSRTIL